MTAPTPTPLARALEQRELVAGALQGALELIDQVQASQPAGVLVLRTQLVAGLTAAWETLVSLAEYAAALERVRDSLAAQVAAPRPASSDPDPTALALLGLVAGLQAACTPPVTVRGYVAPAATATSYTAAQVAKIHADAWAAGYQAAAAGVLDSIATRLA